MRTYSIFLLLLTVIPTSLTANTEEIDFIEEGQSEEGRGCVQQDYCTEGFETEEGIVRARSEEHPETYYYYYHYNPADRDIDTDWPGKNENSFMDSLMR